MGEVAGELAIGLGAAVAVMVLTWLVSLLLDDVSIVDPVWGAGFVVVGWVYAAIAGVEGERQWLVLALLTLWGGRLSLHLARRKWGEPEDYRYAEMRERNPDTFRYRSLMTVFLLQAAILWLVSWPLLAAVRDGDPAGLTWIDWIALAIFVVGFTFEAGGDLQLSRFKADPANEGKVLDRGFWRYTRHPNYFGDALVWWSFTLLALATLDGWWVLLSPIVMSALLMKYSGVGLLEKRLNETKPAYRDYVERTNAFFPWIPRSS